MGWELFSLEVYLAELALKTWYPDSPEAGMGI